MKKLIELLTPILFNIFDLFFFKKEYIVFSTRSAKAYADNSKVLFEGLFSKHPENVFFYTKKRKVLECIPKHGIYAYSFFGLYVLLKSKLLVFTHGKSDFFPYCPSTHPQRVFINLFHAIAIKKVGRKGSLSVSKEIDKWNYFLVSSQFEKQFIKKQYGFKEKQILILGQPRNDVIIKNAYKISNHSNRLVLYAPTFRDNTITKLFPFDDVDLHLLDSFLGKNEIELMIRLHIQEEQVYANHSTFKELRNIYFTGSDKIPTVNDFLHNVDMLISDYSSITLDYLLLNRPIAYIPYDYDDYEKTRGFSFNYFDHTAGPILKSQSDLQLFLTQKTDGYADKRTRMKNLFHKYQDGQSTKRLIQFIDNI